MRKFHKLGIAAVVAGTAMATLPAGSASAEPLIPIDWKVDATTTMKAFNLKVDVPTGSFKGAFDLGNASLSGDMTLPTATKRIDLGRLPMANVQFAMEQAAPVTGTVTDWSTLAVTTTASFNVRIVSVRPTIMPFVNLVGNKCTTEKPVTTTLGGNVDLVGKTTFSGTYTLPKFKNCGFGVTQVLNAIIPGPGNTFAATFYP